MSILTPPPGDGKARAGRKCELTLESIAADDRLQMRAGGSPPEVVNEYATAMLAGDVFPPVIVFYDGAKSWLSDGFTRFAAARKACRAKIAAEVFDGTRDDAREHAWSANRAHGQPRTNADKRRAVEDCLEAHPDWSDGKIAKATGTSGPFVASVRPKVPTANVCGTRVGRDGKARSVPQPKPAEPAAPHQPEAVATQQADPDEPHQLTDQLGRPVPANLRDLFTDIRAQFTAVADLCQQAQKAIRRADKTPAGGFLERSEIALDQLNSIAADLLTVRAPFCACPSCAGAGASSGISCPECAGRGWLTRAAFEDLPGPLKAKALAFALEGQPEPLPNGTLYAHTRRDSVGAPIPTNLRDTFANHEVLHLLRELKALVHLLDGAKGWMHWLKGEAHEIGAQFVRLVEDSLPFAVCQHCQGKGKGCSHCHTSGYFPRHLHENGHNKPAPKRGAN